MVPYSKHINYEILKSNIQKMLVEEKCYLNPMITRDILVHSLGTNKPKAK